MAWEKQVLKRTPWGTRWHNGLAGFPAEGQESWPLFPGRGKQARQITSQLLRLAWVLLSVCWCMALSGWGPSCRDSPTEKKRQNKSLGFSKVHPSGDEDPDPGFLAELGLAEWRRDGRRDNKESRHVGSFPFAVKTPCYSRSWAWIYSEKFRSMHCALHWVFWGGKKPSKQLENQIFILCGRLLLSRVFLFWGQETI